MGTAGEIDSCEKEEDAKESRLACPDWPRWRWGDEVAEERLVLRESGEVGVESMRWISSDATRTMVNLLINALSSDRFCSACMPNGSLAETEPPLCNTFRER